MKRLAILLLVCACVLAPAAARADDGGWLDWLFRLDPRFLGYVTDFHYPCVSRKHELIRCEELYRIPRLWGKWTEPIPFKEIEHEFSFRFGYYHTYGDVFGTAKTGKAFKLMGFYAYHPDDHVTVSMGAGVVPIFGDVVETRWSKIYTPLSIRYSPARSRGIGRNVQPRSFGQASWAAFFVQGEASFFSDPPTPELFGLHPATPSQRRGEWNAALLIGIDIRR
jgi:hypothetical protein